MLRIPRHFLLRGIRRKEQQTISFGTLADAYYGDGPIALTATASSGLTVSYTSSDVSIASIVGERLMIHRAGKVNITVNQPGNAAYSAATPVVQELTILPRKVIVTPDQQTKIYGEADPELTYTLKPELVEGDPIEGALTRQPGEDVGSYVITQGSLSLNSNYVLLFEEAAALKVTPAERTISFPSLADKTYGDHDFDAGASSNTGEAVSYTSSNPAVVTVSAEGQVRIMGAGEASITAFLPDNPNYYTTPPVTRHFRVHKASQSISHQIPGEVFRDAGNISLQVSASSGLPVSVSLNDELVAQVDGQVLRVQRLGTVQLTLTQEGDANYQVADPVIATLRVVEVEPTSAIPGIRPHPALSPNGDGINDFMIFEGIRDYPENKVTIFNRSGKIVYEGSGYNNGSVTFDGRSNQGVRLPAGTYFYLLEVQDNGIWKQAKGYFLLRY